MTARPRIILTGSGGLIGKALTRRLRELGYEVIPFRSRSEGVRAMDSDRGTIDRDSLEGAAAVIHLAGESIARRWSPAACERILRSRKEGTRLLAETLASLREKPELFLSMSGTSRYGIRRDETVDENSPTTEEGFLGLVAREWEQATLPAEQAGIRTVRLRTGVVLAASGGALRAMLPAFRLGLGGPIGSGRQRMSWIRLGDLVELIIWAISNKSIRGPLNAVAPTPVSQAEFAHALGHALRRPAFLPLPAWVISLLFGKMGRETILSDLAVKPTAALAGGFRFQTPELADALPLALRE